jgi:hypothetical protein
MAAVNGKWLVGFPRHTEEVTFSGGSWEALYPISNLSLLPFSKVARSTNDSNASTIIYGVLPDKRIMDLFLICGDNISETGRLRLKLYETDITSSPTPSAVYDTGWFDRWEVVYEEDSPFASWDSGNWWDRTYSAANRAKNRQYRDIYIPDGYDVLSFSLEIDDEDNPDGYVQIGLLEVATAIEISPAPQLGAQYGFIGRTVATETEGGGKYFERRNKARFFQGVLPLYDRNAALSTFYELVRLNDIDVPFAFIPDINNRINAPRNIFLARNASIDPFTRVLISNDAIPLNFEEVL